MRNNQTASEEYWNTLTHGFGLILSAIGIIVLLFTADLNNDLLKYGLILYSISILLLYATSTAYHFVEDNKLKRRLRVLDHISIYILIAGTYSPVVLTLLKEGNGMLLFYSVWAFALVGTFLKLFFTGRFEVLSLVLYLLMGCLIIFDAPNVIINFTNLEFTMLVIGGFFYTAGIYFYVKTSLAFNHVIWHVFVIFGSLCHFLMIYFSVLRI
ncbi:PAQR family membrane homeostasis protein TrhA [Psychroflexus tropicus]|uniref:PAQR family membrane homeostasis protein TrhA n=1 Tax=Psychroflexus tropicus TaxID=197345 RepID=UPI00037BBD83|nr:hemolysin III family protein [Psychroflexus tropicus]